MKFFKRPPWFTSILCAAHIIFPLLASAQPGPVLRTDVTGDQPHGTLEFLEGLCGWSFYLSEPLPITGLGWRDKGSDGLFESHTITLWKDTRGLTNWPYLTWTVGPGLVSVTVPEGTQAPLDSGYRRVDLAQPLTLEPGGYVVLGSYRYPNDETAYIPVNYSEQTDSRITVGSAASTEGYNTGEGIIYVLTTGMNVGPMLFANVIPEPGVSSLGLAAGVLWALRQFRTSKHK